MAEQATEETVEVSVEDRIADKFVGEEAAEPETQEAESVEQETQGEEVEEEVSEPELVEVELNGEKYQVPPSIKDAIMREADYTAKTTELARTRQAIEIQQKEIALVNERRKFDESVAQDVDNLKMLEAYIKHVETNTNWAELNTDQIVRARLELDQLRNQSQELTKALEAKWNEFQGKLNEERSKLKNEANEALSKAIPSWSEETKGAIEKYAQSHGYPELAVQNMSVLDYQVAWKAMQYDKLQAEKSSALKRASEGKGKVITPSSRKPMSDKTQKYLNFRKQLNKAKTPVERNRVLQDRIADKFGG